MVVTFEWRNCRRPDAKGNRIDAEVPWVRIALGQDVIHRVATSEDKERFSPEWRAFCTTQWRVLAAEGQEPPAPHPHTSIEGDSP